MSPDEITLVDAASRLGFQYLGKDKNKIILNIQGQRKEIELLYLFPFDSDRKRMTIICNDNGVIKLYCKAVIYNLGCGFNYYRKAFQNHKPAIFVKYVNKTK